jgi:hypothetical protein
VCRCARRRGCAQAIRSDLHRIQIRERARVWELPEDELLKSALHATRTGLLTLSWDTVCPHCRGVRDENATLNAHGELALHCACDIDFATDTPESVEVTFRVHPSVREVPDQLYCSPSLRRRIISACSTRCPRSGTVTLAPRLKPGRYTVRRTTRCRLLSRCRATTVSAPKSRVPHAPRQRRQARSRTRRSSSRTMDQTRRSSRIERSRGAIMRCARVICSEFPGVP